MALSRTPQPAIEIGTADTKMTGSTRNNACAKLRGAATALAAHQAASTLSRWMSIDSAATRNPMRGKRSN